MISYHANPGDWSFCTWFLNTEFLAALINAYRFFKKNHQPSDSIADFGDIYPLGTEREASWVLNQAIHCKGFYNPHWPVPSPRRRSWPSLSCQSKLAKALCRSIHFLYPQSRIKIDKYFTGQDCGTDIIKRQDWLYLGSHSMCKVCQPDKGSVWIRDHIGPDCQSPSKQWPLKTNYQALPCGPLAEAPHSH